MNANFSLNVVKPSDPVKQSLPFSYVSLVATSNDGKPHAVQVYSDISAGAFDTHSLFALLKLSARMAFW